MMQEKDTIIDGPSGGSGGNKKNATDKSVTDFAKAFDAVALLEITKDSISVAFNELLDLTRGRTDPYRPALTKLSELVAKLHDSGLVQVGLKIADFDVLREYNVAHDDVPNMHCILTIEDTHFLVRAHKNGSIDLHGENLNKTRDKIIHLGDTAYWNKMRENGRNLDKPEPRFYNYDFTLDDDCTSFVCTVLKTAALRRAVTEMKSLDIEARQANLMSKTSRGLRS